MTTPHPTQTPHPPQHSDACPEAFPADAPTNATAESQAHTNEARAGDVQSSPLSEKQWNLLMQAPPQTSEQTPTPGQTAAENHTTPHDDADSDASNTPGQDANSPLSTTTYYGPDRRQENRSGLHAVIYLFLTDRFLGKLPDGTPRRFIVRTRDVSATGIGFLHSESIEPDTRCQVSLLTHDGQIVNRKAVIQTAHDNGNNTWSIGATLNKAITPDAFLKQAG